MYPLNEHIEFARQAGYLDFTLAELEAMPTLSAAQTADLKIDSDGGTERVWLERVGADSGMEYDNKVTVEFYLPYTGWFIVAEYEAE